MIIIPVQTQVVFHRWPWINFSLIGLCVIFYGMMMAEVATDLLLFMILRGWAPSGMFGHMFLHAGFFHLFGNMMFLWVFGNAVCEKIGNGLYLLLFVGTGLAAAAFHNVLSPGLAVGASGAINGVVGFYLVIYPLNKVSMGYLFFFGFYPKFGSFEITGMWLILFWFLVDLIMAVSGLQTGVAYWAHLGGLLVGVLAGCAAVGFNRVAFQSYDNPTLLTLLGLHPDARPRSSWDPVSIELNSEEIWECDCPSCGNLMRVPVSKAGGKITCPCCRDSIHLEL